MLRAEVWAELVRADADADGATFTVVALHDPRHREPLLLASPLPVTPQALRDLYRDRWTAAQLPLAARQMLGAARPFVHAPETCQRLPELARLAGAVLSYAAATSPAIPPASGTAARSRRRGGCAASSRAPLFRTTFPCPHGSARERPSPPICRRVPGDGVSARHPHPPTPTQHSHSTWRPELAESSGI